MTLVDANGRVFGRWNVVDVSIGLFLLFLLPVLYGAYLLFRPSPPGLMSIEPPRVQDDQISVTVRGANLRPYMRVSFNEHQGNTFQFIDSTQAVVRIQSLPAGVYDVILYDEAQERARLAKALEVVEQPRPQSMLDVAGMFTAVPVDLAAKIQPKLTIEKFGEVVTVGKPEASHTRTQVGPTELINVPSTSAVNVPAVIRVPCTLMLRGNIATCVANQTSLIRDAVTAVMTPAGSVLFQIDQVRAVGPSTAVELRVRFAGERSVVERMRIGHLDMPRRNPFAGGAAIAQLSGLSRAAASLVVSSLLSPQMGETPAILAGDIVTVDATLRATAERGPDGWSYNGKVLKAGRSLIFHGEDYEVSGTILAVTQEK
jgi:hypothetical protein